MQLNSLSKQSSILLKVRQQNSVINNLNISNACHPMKILFVCLARVNEKTQASKTGRKDWRHLGKELQISLSLGVCKTLQKDYNKGAGLMSIELLPTNTLVGPFHQLSIEGAGKMIHLPVFPWKGYICILWKFCLSCLLSWLYQEL